MPTFALCMFPRVYLLLNKEKPSTKGGGHGVQIRENMTQARGKLTTGQYVTGIKSNRSSGWLLHIPLARDLLKGIAFGRARKAGYSSN